MKAKGAYKRDFVEKRIEELARAGWTSLRIRMQIEEEFAVRVANRSIRDRFERLGLANNSRVGPVNDPAETAIRIVIAVEQDRLSVRFSGQPWWKSIDELMVAVQVSRGRFEALRRAEVINTSHRERHSDKPNLPYLRSEDMEVLSDLER